MLWGAISGLTIIGAAWLLTRHRHDPLKRRAELEARTDCRLEILRKDRERYLLELGTASDELRRGLLKERISEIDELIREIELERIRFSVEQRLVLEQCQEAVGDLSIIDGCNEVTV